MPLTFSFDIGYASIGWCVLSSEKKLPEFLGTGVVTFPSDDCLASQRRSLRRTRRHIRSTRQRIERMKRWLAHRSVLSREDLDRPGHPAPFLLAAAALRNHKTLSAWELWTVLRWYAHNRGYDGNTRWSRGEEEPEDTEKLSNARAQMAKYHTGTMAETVCACLQLDPAQHSRRISSTLPYKTLNAAYPRQVVEAEVYQLLRKHLGKIPGLDEKTLDLLFTPEALPAGDRALLASAGIRLPRRYHGGLLFGQLVPRFDNRIISRCPITWAKTYDEAIARGETDAMVRKQADKYAKVPAAKSPEFLAYRFARILANLKADGKPIDKQLRETLWQLAEKQGRLTYGDLEKEIEEHCGEVPTNLEAYFKLHPDSEEALVLDPVMDEVRKAEGGRAKLSGIWKNLTDDTKALVIAEWRKGKAVSFAWILERSGNAELARQAMEKEFAGLRPRKGEPRFSSFEEYLRGTRVGPKIPSGRAPYARPVLRQVVEEVRKGWDPTKASLTTDPENGEDKPENGVLYDLGIPGSRVRQLQAERPIDRLTNNHLVRHRMLILGRLLDDLLAEFCTDGKNPGQVIVEVARELKEFSGMTAKQIATELKNRLNDFTAAVEHLKEHAPHLLEKASGRGSILRKCRIAMDLGWRCPFTGETYDAADLRNLEREHIIPYATRNTNALHALVLTWPAVNRMKGKRTARQFILDDGGKQVVGMDRLMLFTPKNYDAFVDKLDAKGHPDDIRRKKARKALLATTDFEDKELGFTDGQLTQTSQLMKLAMGAIRQKLPGSAIHPIPGPVTAEIRKAWNLTGTLALACPEVLDPDGNVRPKNEIRSLTHLHHALDAATLAIASHYFPLTHHGQDQKGKIWQALLRRYRTAEEKEFLHRTGIFKRFERPRRNAKGKMVTEFDVRLEDLPESLKNALARSLAESRVMQHLPADQSGAKLERTTWGVVTHDGDYTILIQRSNRSSFKFSQNDLPSKPRWIDKEFKKSSKKLFDRYGHLLSKRHQNLVKRGLLKLDKQQTNRLIGPFPSSEKSKLQPHGKGRGALIIKDNFAISILPYPILIPFSKTHQALSLLQKKTGKRKIPLLRIGSLIRVQSGTWKGIWRICSIKHSEAYGVSVDLSIPHAIGLSKGNARVSQMILDGLEILPSRYSGHPINH